MSDPGFVLLDVRSRDLFLGLRSGAPGCTPGHIKGAVNASLARIKSEDPSLMDLLKDKTVIVYCTRGKCSAAAAAALTGLGHGSVKNYCRGMAEWAADPAEEVYMEEILLTPDCEAAAVSLDVAPDRSVAWSVASGDASALSLDTLWGPRIKISALKDCGVTLKAAIEGQASACIPVFASGYSAPSSSGGGGCSVGFDPALLLLALPLMFIKR